MKSVVLLSLLLLAFTPPLKGANSTFIDYQNYNHGYCPDCNSYPCHCNRTPPEDTLPLPPADAPDKPNPCNPAPVCAVNCGVSLCWLGLGIAAVAATAAILISSNHGALPSH